MASISNNFFIRDRRDELIIADLIEDIPFLSFKERHLFSLAPLNVRRNLKRDAARKFRNRELSGDNVSTLTVYYDLIR